MFLRIYIEVLLFRICYTTTKYMVLINYDDEHSK